MPKRYEDAAWRQSMRIRVDFNNMMQEFAMVDSQAPAFQSSLSALIHYYTFHPMCRPRRTPPYLTGPARSFPGFEPLSSVRAREPPKCRPAQLWINNRSERQQISYLSTFRSGVPLYSIFTARFPLFARLV